MTPSERIKHIKQIADELESEEWTIIDLTLKQFELPWTDSWSGSDKSGYVIEMLSNVDSSSLLELSKHLGISSQLETIDEPSFWKATEPRVFLSHLAKHKVATSDLRDELAKYGIKAFVAHEDIEPTKEWQSEIESALLSMDALVALLTPNFRNSNWCDQEVGVAIGRKIPLLSVRLKEDPYGFIGKYQAIQGSGKPIKQLALEIYEIFIDIPSIGQKITNQIVELLINSESYEQSKQLVALLPRSKFVTSKHTSALVRAIDQNSQISDSWGVADKIRALANQIEN